MLNVRRSRLSAAPSGDTPKGRARSAPTVSVSDAEAALVADLVAIARESDATEAAGRRHVLDRLKEGLAAREADLRERLQAGEEAVPLMAARSTGLDETIRAVLALASGTLFPAANPSTGDRLAVAAVGGYGRGELAPYSDIDLLFLVPYKKTPRVEQTVEYVLYMLWDLGLKVGHATRSVDECTRLARQDTTIRTALLEARFLWGERTLYDEMRADFWSGAGNGNGLDFVEAKLAERDARHQRLGDSRYLVEPNVKDGKGGLRDLHTLYWIAKYLYRVETIRDLVREGVFSRAEVRRFAKAEAFLSTVRCHLHTLTGRAEERLTVDVQPELAARLGYGDRAGLRGVERFMKHYYLTAKDVGDLTRIFCAALEAAHRRRPRFSLARLLWREQRVGDFQIESGRITVRHDDAFREDPVNFLRLFHTAQRQDLDIHPHALRLIRRDLKLIDAKLRADDEANRLFLEMLTAEKDPQTTLTRLNEANVLGRFIQEFGRVVAQMQYDLYHVYTVDEHTIRAIGILRAIEEGRFREETPVASEVVHKVLSRRVLYLALFLHDIAKGRAGDHSTIGARIALHLCPRLGLTEAETETVSWLVRHHLAMSAYAFKRDPSDPKTVQDFAELVQSPERLRLLLVLTVADIRAVGPAVWNGWKAALLRDLYRRTEEVLSGGAEATAARIGAAKTALRQKLADWSADELDRHFASGPDFYWTAWDTDTLAHHARLLRATAEHEPPLTIEVRVAPDKDVTEVTVCTLDHPGLFSRIAGSMAVAGANIVNARGFTLLNGFVIDTFWVQDAEGKPFLGAERLEKRIRQGLSGEIDIQKELNRSPPWPARTSVFRVAPQVLIDNKASRTYTVIEVAGRDRPGFLNRVTWELTKLGLQIALCRINTFGERAVDVFYVKDVFGLKIDHEAKLQQIRERLLAAISDDPAAATGHAAARKTRRRRAA